MKRITQAVAEPDEWVFDKTIAKAVLKWHIVSFYNDGTMRFRRTPINTKNFSKEELESMLRCAIRLRHWTLLIEHLENQIKEFR